ncbi:plasmid pRiA4b ORF-3 family protein [Atopococcus tabaci]|uniref:plasmid pRiA4b ORF-3 family protein n=1 Tax=Atopococcus tabaci TaxID=269774 RepID=UPI00240A0CD6|nr:plasmid pRiA4b ORF-3 family protein [Atopococcus tabaci]
MKAYIIRIELDNSRPLIWRKVIMPAGATFNRLHDVIQSVTNFQGGYPRDFYHFYEFDLREEDMVVTNNDERYLEHQAYKKNKQVFEKRLAETPEEFLEFEQNHQNRLKVVVRKPTGLKIDNYLEKYKTIDYLYDYGDDWRFTIQLEQVVEDYHFGYPTLLDGAETAPPEDVGGLDGFYEFLDVYRNPSHPDHKRTVEWASGQRFREYNPTWINEWMKGLKYKKMEWDQIHHDNYRIIEDKYRSH